jgi:anti-anti-sigma factor
MDWTDSPAPFQMEEHLDADGRRRLDLIGELDLAVAPAVTARVQELAGDGCVIHLDLSRLDFIDSTGIRELLEAVAASRRDGWQLEVSPRLTHQVRRVFELTGVGAVFWPGDEPA